MRKYDLTINDKSYEVTVKTVEGGKATVDVNGKEYTVAINNVQSLVLPETIPAAPERKAPAVAGKQNGAPAPSSAGGVIAPMPGQIKAILVREGDRVLAGQKLLIMEAMKLENKIPADRDGVVKHILVRDGDIVSQGQELVIITN
jgi:biotin carboxyl carrier protein